MNKKNVASFFAGMAVMAVIGTAVYSAGHGGAASSSRLGDRYEAIENKLDTIDKTISNYYLKANYLRFFYLRLLPYREFPVKLYSP